MRKFPILLAVLLALSLIVLAAAPAALLPHRDDVTYTETVLSGDPAAAHGLTVGQDLHYGQHLFWNTETQLTSGETRTEFNHYFSRQNIYSSPLWDDRALYLDGLNTGGYGSPGGLDLPRGGIYEEFQQLKAEAVPGGEEVTKTVSLADYYDYYPISGHLKFESPDSGARYYNDWGVAVSNYFESAIAMQAFSDYFRIPVLSSQQVILTLRLDSSGKVVEYGIGLNYEDPALEYFDLATEGCVVTDSDIYFTINNRTSADELVDTSLIPGGYGIYRLPYQVSDQNSLTVHYDALSTPFTMGTEEQVVEFRLLDSDSRLLLVTSTPDGLIVRLFDADSMAPQQTLDLSAEALGLDPEGRLEHSLFVFDGGMALTMQGRMFPLIPGEDGQYTIPFIVPLDQFPGRKYTVSYNPDLTALAWRDGRLAIAMASPTSWSFRDENDVLRIGGGPGFDLMVFDESGMIYAGRWQSSLGIGTYLYQVEEHGYPALTLSWEGGSDQ